MSLQGKTAFVTGASRGIGRAVATALEGAGARVAWVSSSGEGKGELNLKCDVSQPGEVEAAVGETLAAFGGLDILVNNAGIARDQLLMRMGEQDWDLVLDVNLKGAFNCIKAASKPMMKARWGRIISMSSIVGLSGQAGQSNYAASKAGLIGLTKSAAKELGSRGITCNAIAPGFIETDMTAGLPQEMRDRVLNTAPLGRLGTAEDIAGAVLFLAGDEAAYITGQVLVIDGGLTL